MPTDEFLTNKDQYDHLWRIMHSFYENDSRRNIDIDMADTDCLMHTMGVKAIALPELWGDIMKDPGARRISEYLQKDPSGAKPARHMRNLKMLRAFNIKMQFEDRGFQNIMIKWFNSEIKKRSQLI